MALRLSNLPEGIYMLQLTVEYDTDKLQLTSVDNGEIFSSAGRPELNSSIGGYIYLIWESTANMIDEDCVLLVLHFTLLSDENCEDVVRISTSDDLILANWENEFTPTLKAGSVYLEDYHNYAVLLDNGDFVFFRSKNTYTSSTNKQSVTDMNNNTYNGYDIL